MRYKSGAVVALVAALFITLACSAPMSFIPTQTPYPTYTPYPTFTPVPTLTPTVAPEKEVLFELSDFSGAAMCLPEGEDGSVSNFVEEDGYHMYLEAPESVSLAYCPEEIHYDSIIEVEARQIRGARENEYGIGFRYNESSDFLYAFTISNDGYYSLNVINISNDEDFYLLWGGPIRLIKRSRPNRLKVIVKDDRFEMFVNDEFVGLIYDNGLSGGNVGLFLNTFEQGETEVVFSNLRISSP